MNGDRVSAMNNTARERILHGRAMRGRRKTAADLRTGGGSPRRRDMDRGLVLMSARRAETLDLTETGRRLAL